MLNFEDIMREINKPVVKWTNTVWFHLREAPRVVKIIETESRMVASRAGRVII
jgi:hypothetical protein